MHDSLGDRMKLFERQSASKLLPLIPICARMDGRAFHTFASGLPRPYDARLSQLMIDTTKYLVEETGALIGYTQSDEISLIWYSDDFRSQTFFERNVLKMASILAALTTAYFNSKLATAIPEKANRLPLFDARVWNVPTCDEAVNYLIWREMDATRNSISMAAQSCYSHKQLHGITSSGKQELLWAKGINWNAYPRFFKRGSYIRRIATEKPFTADDIAALPPRHSAHKNPNLVIKRHEVQCLDLPPLLRVSNRVDVVFNGKEPIESQEKEFNGCGSRN